MSELIAGRIGEIVEATTAAFTARCHELYVAPALGTLVRAGGNNPVLGIVAEAVSYTHLTLPTILLV